MVRKKNKGFSLIEVIVAVAILSLLMAPIISQVIQTLNTSAQAKERQYAVENAEYVLNYMQETPVSKLSTLSGKLGVTPVAGTGGGFKTESIDGSDVRFTSCENKPSVNCFIYQAGNYASVDDYLGRTATTAAQISSSMSFAIPVPYQATIYNLENTSMGKADKLYQRKVIVDNLRAVVAANGCTVETNFSDDAIAALKDDGFSITTEGAAVKYDAQGLVTDIICSKVEGLRSPNGSGTSYMQDLDSSKVAIIQGTASNFDAQAENDLYNLKMNRLKATNPDAWVQAMTSKAGSILDGALFNDNVCKMTRVSIVSGYDTTQGLKYYDVNCTVFYEDYLIKNGSYAGGATSDAAELIKDLDIDQDKPEVLTYNAYSHRFYTNQAPDIYLVYEPYVANASNYSNKDYILTYDGVIYGENEKHAKMYIIKPNKGRVVKYNVLTTEPSDWSENFEAYYEKSGEKYVAVSAGEGGAAPAFAADTYYERTHDFTTQLTSASAKPVSIYLNYLQPTDSDANYSTLPIFTNIDLANFKCALPGSNKDGVQHPDHQSEYYVMSKSSSTGDVEEGGVGLNIARKAYSSSIVKDIYEDVTQSDRIYTITVQMDKLNSDGTVYSGYSVRLSGAKGAD
jgi:prepilin-type N-terminal cleavage/methylation domain-containing protein